ncbi:MAG: DUF1674 domain-containing protein [Gammaproteobacteria bacterium]|jgi:hypothetical protein|nr:MAG: DUF1674 domain-containing protein [Gammaproteobacteria bacterium]|tara:strand:+ start:265 stop:444 length:180 start_codon:yes stop_codon:yes gene_type:complete
MKKDIKNIKKIKTKSLENQKEVTKRKRDNSKIKKEIGGRGGLDPSRYGDWEKDGRCIDF